MLAVKKNRKRVELILPSNRNAGGVLLALEFLDMLGNHLEIDARAVALFRSHSGINSPENAVRIDFDSRTFLERSGALATILAGIPRLLTFAWRREKPVDLYIATHWLTFFCLFLVPSKKRLVFFQDAEHLFEKNPVVSYLVRVWMQFWLVRAKVVTTSEELAGMLAENADILGYFPPLPLLVDNQDKHHTSHGAGSDCLFIYKYGKHKNPEAYLELLARNRHLKFTVITTEKDALGYLGKYANVELHWNIARAEVFGLMRQTKVFICLSSHEGFGMPGLEAMGCGIPVLILDNFGSRAYMKYSRIQNFVSPANLEESLKSVVKEENVKLSRDSKKCYYEYVEIAKKSREQINKKIMNMI